MQTHDLVQGSPEWHAYRREHFNASDAPAMMGCSPYKTRAQLLREMATGISPEVDAATQRRFDSGHRFEEMARPLAEKIIGRELYPITGSEGRHSASFDGLTLSEDVVFEHKTLNGSLRAAIRQQGGNANDFLPPHYKVQLEQQCMVSGASRALFMASKWADDQLVEERHCWYTPDPELRAQIVAGWEQFAADLAAYVPPVIAEPARSEAMESLPAVAVRLDGALTVVGNLPSFAVALKAFIAKMPAAPATDNDFATVDAGCKALKRAEEALDAAEAGALASITDVEAMRRAVADCRKLARDTRLAAEKLVERRKIEIKEQAVQAARRALEDHIAELNAELAPMRVQSVGADFPGAIKGLRSIVSMQDALDTTLANGKIAADAQAKLIRSNMAHFNKSAQGMEFLFADLHSLIHKSPDDFEAVLAGRIRKQMDLVEAQEKQRQAEEAARIAAAEQRAREQEAARIANEIQRRADAAEAQARAEARAEAAAAVGIVGAPAQYPPMEASLPDHGAAVIEADAPTSPTAKSATMNLGQINARLRGPSVNVAFVTDVLGIPSAGRDKNAVLFNESQWPAIKAGLLKHIQGLQ